MFSLWPNFNLFKFVILYIFSWYWSVIEVRILVYLQTVKKNHIQLLCDINDGEIFTTEGKREIEMYIFPCFITVTLRRMTSLSLGSS